MDEIVKPITPEEAKVNKVFLIPPAIFEATNALIVKYMNSAGESVVKQKEIVALSISKMPEGTTERDIYNNRWLDIENYYRNAGWVVKYDKPGWDDNYDAFFEFKPKRKISSAD